MTCFLCRRGKENYSPIASTSKPAAGARTAPKQSSARVRFASGVNAGHVASPCCIFHTKVVLQELSQALTVFTDLVDNEGAAKESDTACLTSTSILATPSSKGTAFSHLPAGTSGAGSATPTNAAGLPTPVGNVGRAALPPTPFFPQNTAECGPASSPQAFAWRSRAYNAAFKGRSPPSSRHGNLVNSILLDSIVSAHERAWEALTILRRGRCTLQGGQAVKHTLLT